MRKYIFLLLLISIILFSCQKEIDWGIGTNSNGLLIKTVQKTGSDSVTITYNYDGSNRLIMEKMVGMSQGVNVGNELQIIRDGSGIITKTIQKNEAFIASGIDSVVTNYHYNTSTSRYTSAVFDITLFGFTVSDSAVFLYDAGGNITSQEHYQAIQPMPYELTFKQEYIYGTGSLTQMKQYSYDPIAMAFDLIATFNYTYDGKVNPLNIGKEAIAIIRPGYFGSNNATRAEFIDATDPMNNFTTDIVYTYNVNNKPIAAVSTQTPPGTVSNITYYYQ